MSPDYRTVYAGKWAAHRDVVRQVASRVADMGFAVGFGYGADDEGRLSMPNADPNEPDIFVNLKGEVLCGIEVSGSEKARVPPGDILIRKGKLDHAHEADYLTWFYMVYRRHLVVASTEAWPYREHTVKVGEDRDLYVAVPCVEGKAVGWMYDWMMAMK